MQRIDSLCVRVQLRYQPKVKVLLELDISLNIRLVRHNLRRGKLI